MQEVYPDDFRTTKRSINADVSACRRNRSRVTPTFPALVDGQIKGVGNADKGARIGYMKQNKKGRTNVVVFLLS